MCPGQDTPPFVDINRSTVSFSTIRTRSCGVKVQVRCGSPAPSNRHTTEVDDHEDSREEAHASRGAGHGVGWSDGDDVVGDCAGCAGRRPGRRCPDCHGERRGCSGHCGAGSACRGGCGRDGARGPEQAAPGGRAGAVHANRHAVPYTDQHVGRRGHRRGRCGDRGVRPPALRRSGYRDPRGWICALRAPGVPHVAADARAGGAAGGHRLRTVPRAGGRCLAHLDARGGRRTLDGHRRRPRSHCRRREHGTGRRRARDLHPGAARRPGEPVGDRGGRGRRCGHRGPRPGDRREPRHPAGARGARRRFRDLRARRVASLAEGSALRRSARGAVRTRADPRAASRRHAGAHRPRSE